MLLTVNGKNKIYHNTIVRDDRKKIPCGKKIESINSLINEESFSCFLRKNMKNKDTKLHEGNQSVIMIVVWE
jgi:hypothetical protein